MLKEREQSAKMFFILNIFLLVMHIILVGMAAWYLGTAGTMRDELGLSGPAPFYAMNGLWVALLASGVLGIVHFLFLFIHFSEKTIRVLTPLILLSDAMVLGFSIYILFSAATYYAFLTGMSGTAGQILG